MPKKVITVKMTRAYFIDVEIDTDEADGFAAELAGDRDLDAFSFDSSMDQWDTHLYENLQPE